MLSICVCRESKSQSCKVKKSQRIITPLSHCNFANFKPIQLLQLRIYLNDYLEFNLFLNTTKFIYLHQQIKTHEKNRFNTINHIVYRMFSCK